MVIVRYLTDGTLDGTFGEDGIVLTPLGNYHATANELILQPDGKLLAIGEAFDNPREYAVLRYLPDGTLDPGFGENGIVSGEFDDGNGPYFSEAYTGALQPDNKILIAGRSIGEVALARLNPDGSLDESFDENGIVVTPDGETAYAMTILPDGKILVGGVAGTETDQDVFVARYISGLEVGTIDISK